MSVHDFPTPDTDFVHMRFTATGEPARPFRRTHDGRDLWVDIVGNRDLINDAAARVERAITRGPVPTFEQTDVALAQQYFDLP